MRSWNKWFVASLVPLVCFAVLLVTGLLGQETGKSPANASLEAGYERRDNSPAQPQAEDPTAGEARD